MSQVSAAATNGWRQIDCVLFGAPMSAVHYRYELRRGDEIVATGHLACEEPLEVGDRLAINSSEGIVRIVEPLLGEREGRLVVELVRDSG